MRSLKKVLALVLVLAMALSCVLFASAAYNDAADITYTTAVNTLTGVNIIEGYPNGNFGPKDAITRGQICTMIYRAKHQGTEDGINLYAGLEDVAKFVDVTSANWDRNFVWYAFASGYVSGGPRDENGNANFWPNKTVTGYECAKMLLGMLGYDQEAEGYTGTGWEANVLNDGLDAGLFEGVDFALDKELNREEAALMFYNAMQAQYVTGYNNGQPVKSANTALEDWFDVTTVEAQVVANEYASIDGQGTITAAATYIKQPAGTTVLKDADGNYYVMELATGIEDFGRTYVITYKDEDADGAFDAEADTLYNVVKADTDKVYTADLDTASNLVYKKGAVTGDVADTLVYTTKAGTSATSGDQVTLSIAAANIYYNYGANEVRYYEAAYNNTYWALRNNYFGTMGTLDELRTNRQVEIVFVDSANGTDYAFVNEFGYATVTTKEVLDNGWYQLQFTRGDAFVATTYYGYTLGLGWGDLAVGDKILIQKIGHNAYCPVTASYYDSNNTSLYNLLWYVKAPETITGKLTASVDDDESLIINGTSYQASKAIGAAGYAALTAAENFNKELTFTTDGKYILGIVTEDEAPAATPTYSYAGVMAATTTEGVQGADVFSGSTEAVAKVQLYLQDGTTKIYDVNKFTNGALTQTLGQYTAQGTDAKTFDFATLMAQKGKFVAYELTDDGKVNITVIGAGVAGIDAAMNVVYTEGNNKLGAQDDADKYVGNDTVFFVNVYNNATDTCTFKVYTGRDNLPSIEDIYGEIEDYVVLGKMFAAGDKINLALIYATTDGTVSEVSFAETPVASTDVNGIVLTDPTVYYNGTYYYQTFSIWNFGTKAVQTVTSQTTEKGITASGIDGGVSTLAKYGTVTFTVDEKGAAAISAFTFPFADEDYDTVAGCYAGYIENVGTDFVEFVDADDPATKIVVNVASSVACYKFADGAGTTTSLAAATAANAKGVVVVTNAQGAITTVYYFDVAADALS